MKLSYNIRFISL